MLTVFSRMAERRTIAKLGVMLEKRTGERCDQLPPGITIQAGGPRI